jgi:hypothetical protein
MNRLLMNFLLTVFLLIPLCLLPGGTVLADDEKAGALITVESYLNSLFHGDIPGIKITLSPRFLRKTAPTLDSQSYAATLRSLYANAKFRIVGAGFSGPGRIKVDTELTLGVGQLMKVSFLVVRDAQGAYLIDEEVQ